MFEQLEETLAHFLNLEALLSSPDVLGDNARYTGVMKEYKSLEEVIDTYRAYKSALDRQSEALEMLSDALLHDLASEELKAAREEESELADRLTFLLLPHDLNDDKNVIVEIRAGAGGEEAALFVSDLYRMYSMFCEREGYKLSLMSDTPTELGGHRQLAFSIEGQGAFSRFKFESGVHRVQRVPVTESQGRIQTSTVTVAVLPEAEEVSVTIRPEDIVFESCKSSGAGGQHINKTESAVRLTHKPTGIVVECQQERSQFKNKDVAMKMLRAILYDQKQTEQNESIAGERRKQVGTGDRSEKIRTYNFPQSRVTDHRIGMSLYSIEKFMNGEISELLDALATADTSKKLTEDYD